LLLDLLTPEEDTDYEMRFDIDLLTERLGDAVHFVHQHAPTQSLPVGLFGASTGAASALRVAAAMPDLVGAVVSRGGRPDLTGDAALSRVNAPTLLIVGGADHGVIELNQAAHRLLQCEKAVAIVSGATHLFEEPGTLEQVARLARDWFIRHLVPVARPSSR
jgi:pimeloyl-ACP methyl ester carboxylesterase